MKNNINSDIDNQMWRVIDEIGWSTKTVDYEMVVVYLQSKYSREFLERFEKFVVDKYKKINKLLNAYSRKKNNGDLGYFLTSDDGFMDLTYHIIGLGQKEYEAVLKNPERARKRAEKDDFVECFGYVLHFDWKFK